MGQNLSTAITPPPLTFQDCVSDGKVHIERYFYFKRREEQMNADLDQLINSVVNKKRTLDEDHSGFIDTTKTARSIKRHKLLARDDDGSLREVKHTDTIWYRVYIKTPPCNKRLLNLFRNRFRLPYGKFIELSEDIFKNDLFLRWSKPDCTGISPSNLKFLLLGSLRYIGRSWTFDDIEESNGISREVNRIFYIRFIEYGSKVMFQKYVVNKSKNIDNANNEILYRMAGFNGCLGSSDATHIIMLKLASWATIAHKGFKLNLPARTYNLTVSHTKQILSTTTGHPSTWNDKTIVLFDELPSGVHNGELFDNNEFSLYEYNLEGNIIEVKYKGV